MDEGKVVVPLERLATQLFCAARVFTVAVLGDDLDERGGTVTVVNGVQAPSTEGESLTHRLTQIISALSAIEEQGSRRAGRMKVLLTEICGSISWADLIPSLSDNDWIEALLRQPPDADFLSLQFAGVAQRAT